MKKRELTPEGAAVAEVIWMAAEADTTGMQLCGCAARRQRLLPALTLLGELHQPAQAHGLAVEQRATRQVPAQ